MTQTHGMTAAAEVWRVSEDETRLALAEAIYGGNESLRLASSSLSLSTGEGLAGAVLARRVPVFLEEFDDESFERAVPARADGVAAVLGLPVFDQAKLTHVVLFMFRGGPDAVGAVELWAGRRGRFELGLTEAYYAGLERFGKVSRHVNFPMGSGLPGMIWQTAMPRVLTGVGRSREFLRSSGAESAGLTNGFGYPVIERNELKAVMLWLSSSESPLARVQEVWRPGEDGWKRVQCASEQGIEIIEADEVIERCVAERAPILAEKPGCSGVAALPVMIHENVRAVGVIAW